MPGFYPLSGSALSTVPATAPVVSAALAGVSSVGTVAGDSVSLGAGIAGVASIAALGALSFPGMLTLSTGAAIPALGAVVPNINMALTGTATSGVVVTQTASASLSPDGLITIGRLGFLSIVYPTPSAVAISARASLIATAQSSNAFAILLATRQFVMADLFTITLGRTGQTLNYTSLDRPLWYQGTYFDAFSLQISGLQFKKSVGLVVDEQSITISATRDMLVNGRPWFGEIANGLLDNAEIRRLRVFAADWHSPIVGSVILFDGIVSTIDSLTATQCQLKVKSYLSLLNQPMPRNSWQSSCLHTLFDAGCGLSRAAYQLTGSVESGSTVSTINWSGATPGYYWQGTVQFISGPNTGLTRTIKLSTGSQLLFHLPLPEAPLSGDAFYAWPGCDKTFSTCQSRFKNTAHNRSYPYIPSPTIAL